MACYFLDNIVLARFRSFWCCGNPSKRVKSRKHPDLATLCVEGKGLDGWGAGPCGGGEDHDEAGA